MPRFTQWIPLFLFLFALTIRLAAVRLTQFDGLYGQDAFAYFYYALDLRAALAAGQPPPPFAWPIGYPLLVVLAMAAAAGPQVSAGQAVNLLSGAAVAPLVYLIVLEYRSQAYLGGLFAGVLAAVTGQLLLYSMVVMSDATGLFWATLSAWLLLRYLSVNGTAVNRDEHRYFDPSRQLDLGLIRRAWLLLSSRRPMGWLAAAAAALALAILSRWVYGLLVIPWGAAGLLAVRERALPWRQTMATAAVALAIGVVMIGSQFYGGVGGELSHVTDLRVVRWQPANVLKSVTENSDGLFDYGRPTGLYYLQPLFSPTYLFPLFTPLLLLGILALKGVPYSRLALLVGWPLIVYLFLAGIAWQNWRFPLALLPPLLVLAGLGLDWLWQRPVLRWRPWLLVVCLFGLVGSAVAAGRHVENFVAWTNQTKQIAQDVAQQIPAEATLLAFGLTSTVQHYTEVETHELFWLGEADLEALMAASTGSAGALTGAAGASTGSVGASTGSAGGVYLLLDPDNVDRQWAGRRPAQNLAWLRTHCYLIPIADYGAYHLYRVDRCELA